MEDGAKLIAGVDEAGRGPLAGPVVAAAVIFDSPYPIESDINDSKKLTEKRRLKLYRFIHANAKAVGVGFVWHTEIDKSNIHRASLEAMSRAVASLCITPDFILVDGRFKTGCGIKERAIVKGDSLSISIAAASIVAKTVRDAVMRAYSSIYPLYGFEGHKGYGCASHIRAIKEFGPCPIHRLTYRPMSEMAE